MATEKRLIEPELLKTKLYEICDEYNTERLHIDRIIDEIDDAPDVDAVEVIRCQNCQYSEPCKPYNKVLCPKMGRYMKQDGFCSEGVMKDGE